MAPKVLESDSRVVGLASGQNGLVSDLNGLACGQNLLVSKCNVVRERYRRYLIYPTHGRIKEGY